MDGVAGKAVVTKSAAIKVADKAPAKRAPASKVPLPETLATHEPVPAEVVLSGPPEYWQEACADLMKRDRILRK
ncbi:hypothetical protein, partial [Bacillus mycoides]|uniref:hypothetical protein n=1 Tax=Bacillus mycoides TaxID=1405 RepID=UPI0005340114